MVQISLMIVMLIFFFTGSTYSADNNRKVTMAHAKHSVIKRNNHKIQFKKGQYIIRYKHGTDETIRNTFRKKFKGTDKNISANTDRILIDDTKQNPETTLQELSQNTIVEFAEPDIILKSLSTDNNNQEIERLLSRQWMFRKHRNPGRSIVFKGKTIRVGILDTGIDSLHEDLPLSKGISYIRDTLENGSVDSSTMDHNGHGTKVAGVIGANTNNDKGIMGVANHCTLVPIKVFTIDGDAALSDVIKGIEWATKNNIQVLNMSFGTYEKSIILEETINRAALNGIIMLGAAGNDANGSKMFPGAFQNVLCVGSSSDDGLITDFSNFGKHIDILAPGKVILGFVK